MVIGGIKSGGLNQGNSPDSTAQPGGPPAPPFPLPRLHPPVLWIFSASPLEKAHFFPRLSTPQLTRSTHGPAALHLGPPAPPIPAPPGSVSCARPLNKSVPGSAAAWPGSTRGPGRCTGGEGKKIPQGRDIAERNCKKLRGFSLNRGVRRQGLPGAGGSVPAPVPRGQGARGRFYYRQL